MRDYQRKLNNSWHLPRTLYRRVLAVIRDYDRQREEINNILYGTAEHDGLSSGVPDRIVLVPMGRIYFVETKAPGKKLRKLQEWVCGLIKGLGFAVLRLDTKDKVDAFVREVMSNGI